MGAGAGHQLRRRAFGMAALPASERVVLITGAAGGLGKALVAEFAEQGWRVVAASRHPSHSEMKEIWAVGLDVTDRNQAESAVDQVVERWKRVDVLINNAGATADGSVLEMEDASFEKVLSVNLKGAFICSQMVLRPMLRQRDGHIVNISSFSG